MHNRLPLTGKQELIEKLSNLSKEHADLQSDYLSERDIRRNYQNRIDEGKRVVVEHERQLVSTDSFFQKSPCDVIIAPRENCKCFPMDQW